MQKNLIIAGGIFVLIAALLVLNRFTTSSSADAMWRETGIACLPNGHENLKQHIHPHLALFVDGEAQVVPAGIGLTPSCMAEIHTHDATGKIHIESRTDRTFTLAEFFEVADMPLEREGYVLSVTADGQPIDDPSALILLDGQSLEVRYESQ